LPLALLPLLSTANRPWKKLAATGPYKLIIRVSITFKKFEIVKSLPIKVNWRWVKGYQKEKCIRDLDWWRRMNDYVVGKAKAFLKECTTGTNQHTHKSVRLLHEHWAFQVHGEKVSSIDKKSLYRTRYAPRTHAYWTGHHDIPITTVSPVDWEPSRLAIQHLPVVMRHWRVKFCSSSIGVGNALLHRIYQDHSDCPMCKKTNEKVSHVLLCPDDGTVTNALQKITGPVTKLLDEKKTYPLLRNAILNILTTNFA